MTWLFQWTKRNFKIVIGFLLNFFSSKRSHAFPLFVASNILPINALYFETVFTIMHDVSTRSTLTQLVEKLW